MENEIRRSEKMLARWRGKPARMQGPEGMKISCVNIIVSAGEPGKNLLVSCIGPRTVSGPRQWSNSSIILRPYPVEEGREGVEVLDEANGVRIVGGTFEVKENVKIKGEG